MNSLIYANSKIKLYEKSLLTDSFLRSLIQSGSYEETINQLINLKYIPDKYKNKSVDEISEFKENELKKKIKDLEIGSIPFDDKGLSEWHHLEKELKSNNPEAENKKINFLKRKKGDVFGIYPIIAYHYAFLSEIRNIRIILTGKRLGVPFKEIEERLCITYV